MLSIMCTAPLDASDELRTRYPQLAVGGWAIRQLALPRDLHVASLHHVDHWCFRSVLFPVEASLFRYERPKPFHVDGWDDLAVLDQVKVTHAYLPEKTRVVLVKIDAMVVLPASLTTPARVLAVFPDAPATVRDLPPEMAALLEARRHGKDEQKASADT